jgi:hypothetical protein
MVAITELLKECSANATAYGWPAVTCRFHGPPADEVSAVTV